MNVSLTIAALACLITLLYASRLDLRERRVPVKVWQYLAIVGIPMMILTYYFILTRQPGLLLPLLLMTVLFVGLFYASAAWLHLIGGADAWAFISGTLFVPLYPFVPLSGLPLIVFFPFAVLINTAIVGLIAPLGVLASNLWHRNKGPLSYLLTAMPVPGEKIAHYHGYVMEEFSEKDGVLSRRFIGQGEALRKMVKGSGRIYTGDLRMHPEDFETELALYRQAGTVWISYGLPFLVPVTAGFVLALFFGDLLYLFIQIF